MPFLPPLPELTQPQFDLLVEVFTAKAVKMNLPGPVEAYVQAVLDYLVAESRQYAWEKVDQEVEALRFTRAAEVEAKLNSIISGAAAASVSLDQAAPGPPA